MLNKEGYATIAVVFIFSFTAAYGATFLPVWITYIIYAALAALCLLVLYFFRDPERTSPDDDSLIISPADGKVVLIQEVDEPEYMKGKATQISIFLSPLNVHVNRNPLNGKLEYLKYYPGKYLMAWEDHASDQNERAHFGVKHSSGMKMMFKQITGFLARRIVYYVEEGEQLKAGERFGIMKFGSRMDLLLPDNVEIKVKKGQNTVAGETIIGEIK
ncbi:MAG: phosphatidylserine decarboxylase family protein [Balneolaceae bacterium]